MENPEEDLAILEQRAVLEIFAEIIENYFEELTRDLKKAMIDFGTNSMTFNLQFVTYLNNGINYFDFQSSLLKLPKKQTVELKSLINKLDDECYALCIENVKYKNILWSLCNQLDEFKKNIPEYKPSSKTESMWTIIKKMENLAPSVGGKLKYLDVNFVLKLAFTEALSQIVQKVKEGKYKDALFIIRKTIVDRMRKLLQRCEASQDEDLKKAKEVMKEDKEILMDLLKSDAFEKQTKKELLNMKEMIEKKKNQNGKEKVIAKERDNNLSFKNQQRRDEQKEIQEIQEYRSIKKKIQENGNVIVGLIALKKEYEKKNNEIEEVMRKLAYHK